MAREGSRREDAAVVCLGVVFGLYETKTPRDHFQKLFYYGSKGALKSEASLRSEMANFVKPNLDATTPRK